MAKPLVSASYDKSRFLVMHDPDAHPLESLARGKSSVRGNPVSVHHSCPKRRTDTGFLLEKTNRHRISPGPERRADAPPTPTHPHPHPRGRLRRSLAPRRCEKSIAQRVQKLPYRREFSKKIRKSLDSGHPRKRNSGSIMLCRGRRSPSRDANFGGAGIVPAQRDRPVPLFSNPAPPRSARIPKKNLPSWGDSGLDGALRGDVRGRPSSQADPDRVEPTPNGCGFGSRTVEGGSISSGSPWVTTRMLRWTNHGRDYDAPIPGRFQQRFVHMEPGGRQFEGCRRE